MEETYTPTRVTYERDTINAPDPHPYLAMLTNATTAFVGTIALQSLHRLGGWQWGVALAILIGCIFGILAFWAAMLIQYRMGIRERTIETPVTPTGDDAPALRVMAANPENHRNFTVASYSLSAAQLRRLAIVLSKTGWKMTRDTVRNAKVLPTANWGEEVLPRFIAADLVDENGRVTPRGRAYFEAYLDEDQPPTPAPFVASRNPAAPPPPEVARARGV